MVMEAHPNHQMDTHHLDAHQGGGHPLEARTLEAQQLEKSRAISDSQAVETNPSPECVGLEFVRQYYTILNKAPWHLHRFYATNSSFMHSGENSNRQAVIGQNNIHKSIMSLKFSDCHAKILLIDSQSTLAEGIVIQVTGELSNNGSPMRRFMQTFVLAPQSEKKYYVHNDIFRYQDQVFNDDSSSQVDEGSDEAEEAVTEEPEVVVSRPQINGTSAPPPAAAVVQPQPVVQQQQPAVAVHQSTIPTPVVAQTPAAPPAAAVTPPPAAPPVTHIASPPRPVEVASTVTHTPPQPKQDSWSGNDWSAPTAANEWSDPVAVETPPQPSKRPETTPPPKPEKKPPTAATAPQVQRSYACFFKQESGSAPAPAPVQQPIQPPQETTPKPTTQQQASLPPKSEKQVSPPMGGGSSADGGGFQRAGRGGRGLSYRQRNNTNYSESEDASEGGMDSYNDRRRSAPPDTHQIFVGNLPQIVKEDDLKRAFQTYGTITDVRINIGKGKMTAQNGNSKSSANHVVPNFGFVTFSDDAAVAKCLRDRPITILEDHRLNVEEKKTKSKVDFGGPRPPHMRSSMGGRGGFNRMEGGRGGQRGGYVSNNRQQR